jgi:RimJ/RimL family protein N-acetyltransferase
MRVFIPQDITLADGRQLLVRAAYPTDAPALLLGLESVAREGHIGSEPGERTLDQTRDLISQHDGRSGLLLVAMDAGHLAGACGLSPGPLRRTAHVLDMGMFVLPAWRGSGLAKNLLEIALAWAQDSGFSKVTLGVLASNARAISFYRKMGFAEEGCRKEQYLVQGNYEDEILMARHLREPETSS